MARGNKPGPSVDEIKVRAELDRARREIIKLKQQIKAGGIAGNMAQAPGAVPEPGGNGTDLAELRRQVEDLGATKQRLSRLYFAQLEDSRRREAKIQRILDHFREATIEYGFEALLPRIAETVHDVLGFRVVLIRVREPGTQWLRARAFAGVSEEGRRELEESDVGVDTFLSWLRDEFKISRSYYIRHDHDFSRTLPAGYGTDLGPRAEWEWHQDDVLLVPQFNRHGELVTYLSVDDPVDRLVPSRETIQLLELFASHAGFAIENARLYQELEQRRRELEDAGQHLHELHQLRSQFVSTVSHELLTPLTSIRAYVDALLTAPEGSIPHGQMQRFLSIVNDEGQRLARLIESVLDLNRFDSGRLQLARQSVDMGEILEEAARILEPVAQVGQVRLKIDNAKADTRIDANRDQMRQLALHLGSNAIKFTPAGGTVTLGLMGDDREVVLRVEDTGIGIPEHALEKVFERFYQVESSLVRRYGGAGLGLAVCKSIVDWHGGRIFAESAQGSGSRFTVALPRRPVARVAVRPVPRPNPAVEDVLRLAIEMVADVMNARVVSLLAPDPEGGLVIRVAIGLQHEVVRDARVMPGSGVAAWVAEHRRPVCVSALDQTPEVMGSGRRQYQSGTFLSVPLESEAGLLGVLNVTDPLSAEPFDAEDCHMLLHLADRVAAAWDQALSMERSQADVAGTTEALREVLRHLDRGRKSAPDRVRLARAVARRLELPESETGVISFAASIHDVGMRRLGEHVSDHPGALSAEARAELQRHPELGVEVLGPLDTVGVVRDIVLAHHEWWDGSGYPRGLAGETIPVGSRIIAVVDAYESMTVGRAHRAALRRDDAVAELKRLSGRQFDPKVVEAFEQALADVEREGAGSATGTSTVDTTDARR